MGTQTFHISSPDLIIVSRFRFPVLVFKAFVKHFKIMFTSVIYEIIVHISLIPISAAQDALQARMFPAATASIEFGQTWTMKNYSNYVYV